MSDVITEMREVSKSTAALGILTVFLGMVAIMSPLFSGLAMATLIGLLLVVGGIAGTVYAFGSSSFKEGVWKFLFGGLALLFGIIMCVYPAAGLGALTVMLTIFFVLEGITKIILAFKFKPEERWGWILFSGIISLLFAALIFIKWPFSGMWAVGITVGVWLLMFGLSMVSFGATGKEAVVRIQDERLSLMEKNLLSLAMTVQDNQVDIANCMIVQMGLQAGMSQKVSKSDVDPALTELNTTLAQVRKGVQEASVAAEETGKAVGREARDALQELRKKIEEAAKDLDL